MSANTLGISLDDPFQQHGGKGQDCWQVVTTYTRTEEPISFCGRVWQPYIEDDFLPYQRHEFVPNTYGSHLGPSQERRQTLSALQSWNTDVAVDQMRVRSLNLASGFNAHQLNSSFQRPQVSTCNQIQDSEVSSSCFKAYPEYGRYSRHPLATHHQSFEHTPAIIMPDKPDSTVNEKLADLSLPQYVVQNVDSEGTLDENSFGNTDVSQRTYYGRGESPRLTYTHLSDVSDDSEDDLDENSNIPKRFNRRLAKKRFEKLRPYQLALPLISTTYPIIERPSIPTIDPVATYAQMVMNPLVDPVFAALVNCWLIQSIIHDINELYQNIPERKQEQKIIELEDDSTYKHNDVIQNVAARHVLPVAEDDVIDLTQDDDDDDDDEEGMGNEQLDVQHSPCNHHIQADEATLEETVQQSTPKVSLSIDTLTPTSSLESSTTPVDSIVPPEKDLPSSSQSTSAQQSPVLAAHSDTVRQKYASQHLSDASPTNLLPDTAHIQKHKKRPYRKRKGVFNTAGCSGPKQPRKWPKIQSKTTRSTCANVRRNKKPRNHQAANKEAHCVALSHPRRSPRLQRAGIKCASATKKRSREPWNHKGLIRFIAQYAFNLPRHVWKQKDGGPRRSTRLARKMQRNRYLLRTRLHTKS